MKLTFKPFVDGRNWIVREPLTYRGIFRRIRWQLPVGFRLGPFFFFFFFFFFFSAPHFIPQNGPSLLPAVVHDYLYWKQTCTRDQADQILLLAMIEHTVPEAARFAIYQAVHFAGMFRLRMIMLEVIMRAW